MSFTCLLRTRCSRRPGRLLKHTQASAGTDQLRWIEGHQGPIDIGHDGAGFAYDCEGPRHTIWLAPHALADRLTANGEWCEFVEDRGYSTASLWLSDGWTWVQGNGIEAPLHWRRDESGEWLNRFGLDGPMPIDPTSPVQHVSYYEADAFARWPGARLPTEAEWESAAAGIDPEDGTFRTPLKRFVPCPRPQKTEFVNCLVTCGNGPPRPLNPTPASARLRARLASTPANSCRASSY